MLHKFLIPGCALLVLAGCSTGRPLRHPYPVATVSYEYVMANHSEREWRAHLTALDECHMKGYVDAQLKAPPQTICEKPGARGCTLYKASVAYDCIGMGSRGGS